MVDYGCVTMQHTMEGKPLMDREMLVVAEQKEW